MMPASMADELTNLEDALLDLVLRRGMVTASDAGNVLHATKKRLAPAIEGLRTKGLLIVHDKSTFYNTLLVRPRQPIDMTVHVMQPVETQVDRPMLTRSRMPDPPIPTRYEPVPPVDTNIKRPRPHSPEE
jgi:hypothetical protein